jgi:hypothetical protein
MRLIFIENLNQFPDASRRVNSGVRFLLNGQTQRVEPVNLTLTEAEDFLKTDVA